MFFLWRLPDKRGPANKILGVLLLAISYLLLWGALHDSRYIVNIPNLMGTGPAVALTFGPLLYFYTKAILNNDFRFSKIDILHFIPALIFLATQIPFYLKSFEQKQAIILAHYNISHFRPIYEQIPNIQIFIYLVLIMFLLYRHRKNIKQYYSFIEKIRLDWLRKLTYVAIGIWGVFIVLLFLYGVHLAGSIMALLLALFIYAIGYKRMRQPLIFSPALNINSEVLVEEATNNKLSSQRKSGKYEKSGLPNKYLNRYENQITAMMETEKLYKNEELTLQELADQTELSSHHLSQLLNEYLETNFYDFVNRYRVEDVKNALRNPKKDHLTILAIALEAGFKSKSTFYATFKKETGMTPSKYKKSCRK